MRLLTFSFLRMCKFKNISYGARKFSGILQPVVVPRSAGDPNLVEISPSWAEDDENTLRKTVLQDMQVYPDFITEKEEISLLTELEPQLRRMRYEFDHWDNAIQGYRETERSQWSEENWVVLSRVRGHAFGPGAGEPLPHVHVLDLAAAGHIKPHVDAIRFCGDVIAGLCLVSSAVMHLVHNEKKHFTLNALLARRSLYVMKGVARYEFSHAVLGGDESVWRGEAVRRQRRVALICRTKPTTHQAEPPDLITAATTTTTTTTTTTPLVE